MIYLKLLASTLLVLVLSSESPGRYETNISGAGNTGHDLSSAGIKSGNRYFKSENPYSINITGNKTVSEYTKPGEILFTEAFEDTAIFSRGWYDNHNIQISYSEHVKGSKASAEFHFPAGATTPVSGGSIRHKFKETESVCVSYYVKHSENWTGSDRNYHPHEFYLLTNLDGDYSNLAFTHLTAYIEENEGVPQLSIQDGANIDQSRIKEDLTDITEKRAVAGCNGDSDGYGNGSCYPRGKNYWNGKTWRAGKIYYTSTPGKYYKEDWHHVDAFFRLNSIVNGKGVPDGIIRYWYDGKLVIDVNNAMIRTGQHPDMKFNQFVMGPYIGDGSPVDQTFWIDNLELSTTPPGE